MVLNVLFLQNLQKADDFLVAPFAHPSRSVRSEFTERS
jgi:hypothetical protein